MDPGAQRHHPHPRLCSRSLEGDPWRESRRAGWSPGVWSSGADQPWRPQPASPLPRCQVIPQGVAPSPCIPCCLVLTDDRLFTCHEDCQTSFFRSLGTAKLGDISAVSTEPGKEYCVLVSWEWGRGCRACRRKALAAHPGAWLSLGVLPGQPAAPPALGHLPELHF